MLEHCGAKKAPPVSCSIPATFRAPRSSVTTFPVTYGLFIPNVCIRCDRPM
ncbi:hypothetical protein KCP77_06800 [Salmonella enterica subsp. enterica]|nr:hypothetical protein KCP77_06800 [Salmonella enterica subsp. enterica]